MHVHETTEPRTELWRDIDLHLAFGHSYAVTLKPGDTIDFGEQAITIRFAKSGEEVTIERAALIWRSERERTVTIPAEKEFQPKPEEPTKQEAGSREYQQCRTILRA